MCMCVCGCTSSYPQLGLHVKHFIHQTSFGCSVLLSNNDALLKQENPSLWLLQYSLNGKQVALTTDLTQLGSSSLQERREMCEDHEEVGGAQGVGAMREWEGYV